MKDEMTPKQWRTWWIAVAIIGAVYILAMLLTDCQGPVYPF